MARDPDTHVSPLLQALYEGRTEDADALLGEGPTLDAFEAAAVGRVDRLQVLLDADPTLVEAWSPDGFQAIHLAAFFGQAEAAGLLLERGADATEVSRHAFIKVTPLHSAVAQEGAENPRTVHVLLEHGAPVDARAEGGGTALHSAAANGNVKIVRALLAHGADPDATRDDGKTPLDLAREHGHENVVQIAASDAHPS